MRIIFTFLFFALISCTNSGKEKWDDCRDGWSPLMDAIYNDDTDEFTELINKNADVNFVSESENSNWYLTAIEVAIFMENDFAVKKLLLTGKVSHPEKFLMLASAGKSANTIHLLIKYGANPNETEDNGYTATMMASSFGSSKVLECLLKNGADSNKTKFVDRTSALMLASSDIEKVKLLLKYGAKKDIKNLDGETALDFAKHLRPNENLSQNTINELRELLK